MSSDEKIATKPASSPGIDARDGDAAVEEWQVQLGDLTADPEPSPQDVDLEVDLSGVAEPTDTVDAVVPLVDQPPPAARLPAEFSLPQLSLSARLQSQPWGKDWAEDELALLETELRLASVATEERAGLALAAGRAAQRAGQQEKAVEHIAAARALAPRYLPALRAARRLALERREIAAAARLASEERELVDAKSHGAATSLAAELCLAAGDAPAAEQAFARVLDENPQDLWAVIGRLEALCRRGAPLDEIADACRSPFDQPMWRAAFDCTRGRLLELGGEEEAAGESYRRVFASAPDCLAATFGLWRLGLRTDDTAARWAADERLAGLLPEAYGEALARRHALEDLKRGATASAAAALAGTKDIPGLEVRARAEQAAGQDDALLATCAAWASLEEGERRADVLLRLGMLAERRQRPAEAQQAYRDAAAEVPGDALIRSALLRAARMNGDSTCLLELLGSAGEATLPRLERAQLLADTGESAEALEQLAEIIEAQPLHLPALAEWIDGQLQAGRLLEAAQALLRAAASSDDAEQKLTLRQRAARLLARDGDAAAALSLLAGQRADLRSCQLEERVAARHGMRAALADALAWRAEHVDDSAVAARLCCRHAALLADQAGGPAEEPLHRALALMPACRPALVALQLRAAAKGEWREAARLVATPAPEGEVRPETVWQTLWSARLAENAGDFTLAAERYDQLLDHPALAEGIAWLLEDAAWRARAPTWAARGLEGVLANGEPSWRAAVALRLAENRALRGGIDAARAAYVQALAVPDAMPFLFECSAALAVSLGLADRVHAWLRTRIAEGGGDAEATTSVGRQLAIEEAQHEESVASEISAAHGSRAVAAVDREVAPPTTHVPSIVWWASERAELKLQAGRWTESRDELRAALEQMPMWTTARRLARLALEQQWWPVLEETLVRASSLLRSPRQRLGYLMAAGAIAEDRLGDVSRATQALQAVFDEAPQHDEAFARLTRLLEKQQAWARLGQVLARRLTVEISPERRRELRLQCAFLCRDRLDDRAGARLHLREVLADSPREFRVRRALADLAVADRLWPEAMDLLETLAHDYRQQKDLASANAMLAMAAADASRQVLDHPEAAGGYRALLLIHRLRQDPQRAWVAASLLRGMGQADRDVTDALAHGVGKLPPLGSSLAAPALDDKLCADELPAACRKLFQLLEEPLRRLMPGPSEHEASTRLARESAPALWALAEEVAGALGLVGVELNLSPTPRTLRLHPGRVPIISISEDLVATPLQQQRFFCGRMLKMAQCGLALPLALASAELAQLVTAIVRQFVPEFLPRGLAADVVTRMTTRLAKQIPRGLRSEIMPAALECAHAHFDLWALSTSLDRIADRAGTLFAAPAEALAAARSLRGRAHDRALLQFLLSDWFVEARNIAGIHDR